MNVGKTPLLKVYNVLWKEFIPRKLRVDCAHSTLEFKASSILKYISSQNQQFQNKELIIRFLVCQ